ncbi:hypothetical protein B0H13DRAFT_2350447 [Mycena leptocephala]|nr:hypothetical protein B0H13DRAFT_2350447 [Mycena leptocephala]
MPNLAHVAFNSASLCVSLYLVLLSSTQLEIIVFLSMEAQREREIETVCALSDEDIHYWTLAEALIAAMQAGKLIALRIVSLAHMCRGPDPEFPIPN